jgi:hypothetical protein
MQSIFLQNKTLFWKSKDVNESQEQFLLVYV